MDQLSLHSPCHLFISSSIAQDDQLALKKDLSKALATPVDIRVVSPEKWSIEKTDHPYVYGLLDHTDIKKTTLQKPLFKPPTQGLNVSCAIFGPEISPPECDGAYDLGLYTIINPKQPKYLQALLCWLAFQQAQPIQSLFSPSLRQYTIKNTGDLKSCFHTIQSDCQKHRIKDWEGFSTAIMEALTNAIYHAPRDGSGHEIYQKGESIDSLSPEHYVTVHAGLSDSGYLVHIKDQCGTLTPQDVAYWLNQNLKGEGILDSHGRGLFLMLQLVNQMFIAIDPKRSTEIMLMKAPEGETPSDIPSPLYLFSKPLPREDKGSA